MTGDRNLLFGALAIQADLITADQFAEACSIWSNETTRSLPDILCEKGWLLSEDLVHIEYLVERRLAKCDGDFSKSISSFPAEFRSVLKSLYSNTIDFASSDTRETQAIGENDNVEFSLNRSNQRYHLNSLHAAGGIGEIWLARDTDLGRDVAVKRLQTKKSPSELAKLRFLREARITGRLDHPGVVPIYEICLDEQSGLPYYSMRFLKGRTLTEAIQEYHWKRNAELGDYQSLLGLLNAFVVVCNTIAYAHSKGIIHRDLKGENVILGDFGEVVVIDWGLAKELGTYEISHAEDSDLQSMEGTTPMTTIAGHVLGTPSYMAPEQAAGRMDLISPATDIYGLSAILYEILTGAPPFRGSGAWEVLQKVIHDPPQPPSEIVSNIPETLEAICLKGLEKNPGNRYLSADSLAASVQSWVSDLAERRQTADERERFFALSLDLLAIIDERGFLKQTSPAWEHMLGYDRQELQNAPFSKFLDGFDWSMELLNTDPLFDSSSSRSFETRVRHRDGGHRWISWNFTRIAKERSLYAVGRDITELKQSQQLFEGVLQSAPDAMVIINHQGQIVMTNRQMSNIFGYTQQELLGQHVEMLMPKQYRDSHPAKVANFFASSAVRPMGTGRPLRGLHKEGHEFLAEIALSPIYTETGKLVAASIRDVSHRVPNEIPMVTKVRE